MSKQIEALKLALEALDCIYSPLHVREINKVVAAMSAIREALAEQPAQQEWPKPKFVRNVDGVPCITLVEHEYLMRSRTFPPASKPLTDAQIGAVAADIWGSVLIAPQSYQAFARAIEAAHGITGETK